MFVKHFKFHKQLKKPSWTMKGSKLRFMVGERKKGKKKKKFHRNDGILSLD